MAKSRQAVVLVTGASSGLGNAVATFLAKKSLKVYGTSRDPSARPRKADEFFDLLPMDSADGDSVEAAVAEVLRREGRIDALVCNAGMGIAGPVEETPVDEAVRQMDVNFFGAVRAVKAVLPEMRAKGGTILVIGSMAGLTGIPFQAYYSASKYALEGFVESLRLELKPFPVRLAIVEPGDFRTGFTAARKILTRPDSPYAAYASNAISQMERDERGGALPILMARLVHRLLSKRRLATRYRVGMLFQRVFIAAKPFIPSGLFELGFSAMYGLLPAAAPGKPAKAAPPRP